MGAELGIFAPCSAASVDEAHLEQLAPAAFDSIPVDALHGASERGGAAHPHGGRIGSSDVDRQDVEFQIREGLLPASPEPLPDLRRYIHHWMDSWASDRWTAQSGQVDGDGFSGSEVGRCGADPNRDRLVRARFE